jgi:hypothetical protein
MRQSTLKFIAGSAAALSALLFVSGAAFAQGGGNGQGGSGGGNAHSAATAGMTHWGDPVQSPMNGMSHNGMKSMDSSSNGMQSMSPDDSGDAAKTGQ